MKFLIYLIILLGSFSYAEANTWFAKYKDNSGSATGESYPNAWQELNKIVWGPGGIKAGDTLYICGGPWNEMLAPTGSVSGSPDARITIRGDCSSVDPSYADGVFGRRSIESATPTSGLSISLFDDSYFIIENLTFKEPFGVRRRARIYARGRYRYGKHEGLPSETTLTDESYSWRVHEWVGGIVINRTAGDAMGIITGNSATTITVEKLIGGTRQTFLNDDIFDILDDSASIGLWGKTHHVTIRNCNFDLTKQDVGFGVYFIGYKGSKIHDILIEYNNFFGDGDVSIMGYQSSNPVGIYHDIVIRKNISRGYIFYYHRTMGWNLPALDPDGDGSNDNDFLSYGVDIDDNIIKIDGLWKAISFGGLSRPRNGGIKNYIRNNIIVMSGAQAATTNVLQLSWVKEMIIENNILIGPKLGDEGCDGVSIITDHAYRWEGEEIAEKYISQDLIIRHNIIKGARSGCVGKGISAYRGLNIDIHKNYIFDSDIGIKVSDKMGENIKVKDNFIFDSDTGIKIVNPVGTEHAEFSNNVVMKTNPDGSKILKIK